MRLRLRRGAETNGCTKAHVGVIGSVGGLWVKDGTKVLLSSHHPEDLMLASPAWSGFDKAVSVLRGERRLLGADWSFSRWYATKEVKPWMTRRA